MTANLEIRGSEIRFLSFAVAIGYTPPVGIWHSM